MKTTDTLFPGAAAINFPLRHILLLIFIFCAFKIHAQESLLKRKVTLNSDEKQLENVLLEISDLANFTFSYDASIIASNKAVSVVAKNESVRSTLDQILPENIDYKVSGNHLILLKRIAGYPSGKREKFTIIGKVYDAKNGAPLPDVVVFEISSLISSVTDDSGAFSITVPADFERLGLSFNKKLYSDTILFLTPKDQRFSVSLIPKPDLKPAEKIQNIALDSSPPIESLSIVQQIVSSKSLVRASNMSLVRERFAQASFLPMMGTNLKMSGLVENKLSLNVLIGYAYGVNAFEVGGLFNIVRKDVSGFQAGGLGNLVGENTSGVQVGGLFNHNRGRLKGVQVAGLNNLLIDTLTGVQISGVNNILQGGMKGCQIAGINNLTTRSVDGVQIAGLTNLTTEDVKAMQVAGLFNKCKNMRGVQIAGLVNYALDDVEGFQLAGIANKAENIKAMQFAGIANIATGKVSGMQLSGIFNYAKYTQSSQFGLINVADSASGVPVGLISYVRTGFRTPEFSVSEVMPANVAFKIGVKKFYNIFSVGVGKDRWMFGYGIGTEKPLGERTFLSLEYTGNWVNESESFQKDLNLLNRFNVSMGYRIGRKFAITAGPNLSLLHTEWKDPETGEFLTQLAPYTLVEEIFGTTLMQMWVGGKIVLHW